MSDYPPCLGCGSRVGVCRIVVRDRIGFYVLCTPCFLVRQKDAA